MGILGRGVGAGADGADMGTSSESVPPGIDEADWAATMEETSTVVVVSSAWSASVGALATCTYSNDQVRGWMRGKHVCNDALLVSPCLEA